MVLESDDFRHQAQLLVDFCTPLMILLKQCDRPCSGSKVYGWWASALAKCRLVVEKYKRTRGSEWMGDAIKVVLRRWNDSHNPVMGAAYMLDPRTCSCFGVIGRRARKSSTSPRESYMQESVSSRKPKKMHLHLQDLLQFKSERSTQSLRLSRSI